jgi:two-component system response regulator (stage 0 sporulation protein A)
MERILIADYTDEFSSALHDVLKDHCQVTACSNGAEALELLRHQDFRLLIADPMLPELDGITLMECALREGVLPKVLVVTVHRSPYIISRLNRLGVSYIMSKPCRIQAVAERALDLMEDPEEIRKDARDTVTRLLISLGMSSKQRGYACIREAVLYLLEDRQQSMTKELYPAVADRCSGNANQVEKAIRDTIYKAWKLQDREIWPLYFRPCADGTIPKPSNAEFLTRLAEAVLLEVS